MFSLFIALISAITILGSVDVEEIGKQTRHMPAWPYLIQSCSKRIKDSLGVNWGGCKPGAHVAQQHFPALGCFLHLKPLCIWVFLHLSTAPVPWWKMPEFFTAGQRSRDQRQSKAASFLPRKSVPASVQRCSANVLIPSETAVLETWWEKSSESIASVRPFLA